MGAGKGGKAKEKVLIKKAKSQRKARQGKAEFGKERERI